MPFDFVMSRDLVHDAYNNGMTLSAFLERLDPSDQYTGADRQMSAFERQLARYDIRTQSDPINGIVAHTLERFYQDDENGSREERAALLTEWMSRQFRQYTRVYPRNGMAAQQGARGSEGARFPVDVPVNFTLYPPAVFDQLRYQMLQPSALNYLIARTRLIDSQTFKALYLSDSVAVTAAKMTRIEEFGEVPVVQFTTAELSSDVKKYGRRLKISYEQDRRMSLDMVSWAIAYIAAQADVDKEATAVDILVNGDGNSGTAATNTNGSTLDAAAAGALTLKMWLKWRYLWTRPYTANVIVATSNSLVDTFLLNAGSANLAAAAIVGSNMNNAVNVQPVRTVLDGVLAVDNSTVAASTLVGIDANYTLEMIMEAGANIIETDRVISAQYTDIVLTESIGWAVATKGQNRTLAYTA